MKDVRSSGSRLSPAPCPGPAPLPSATSKNDERMCELSDMSDMSGSRPCSGSRWTAGMLPSVGEYQQQHAPRLKRRSGRSGRSGRLGAVSASPRLGSGCGLRQLWSRLLELRRPQASLHGLRLSETLQRYDYRRLARAATHTPAFAPTFTLICTLALGLTLTTHHSPHNLHPHLRSRQVEPPYEAARPGCHAAARRSGHPRGCGTCSSEVQPL